MNTLLARDGRLSDLTIDRYLLDDLSDDERAFIDAHLDAHPAERERLEATREDIAAPLPPLALPSTATASPAAHEEEEEEKEKDAPPDNVVPLFGARRVWAAAAGVLAAAAALLLFVNIGDPGTSGDPNNDFTSKGNGVSLRVLDTDGSPPRAVAPGDKLMFQATIDEDGYFLVLGVDGKNKVYPWHPRGTRANAQRVSKGDSVEPEISMRMDETPGEERIIALRCDNPFVYQDVAGPLELQKFSARPGQALPPLRAGCTQDEVALKKMERP